MKYCKKCKNAMPSKEEAYDSLCFNCYKEDLLEHIEKMRENTEPEEPKIKTHFWDSIKNFFKKS